MSMAAFEGEECGAPPVFFPLPPLIREMPTQEIKSQLDPNHTPGAPEACAVMLRMFDTCEDEFGDVGMRVLTVVLCGIFLGLELIIDALARFKLRLNP